MVHKNNRVQDTLVEDYMTLTTVTLNFKNSVLDIAKRMLAQDISSIAITDDKKEIIGILTERDIVKIIANELPPRHQCNVFDVISNNQGKKEGTN